jgi:hypothetical protein
VGEDDARHVRLAAQLAELLQVAIDLVVVLVLAIPPSAGTQEIGLGK